MLTHGGSGQVGNLPHHRRVDVAHTDDSRLRCAGGRVKLTQLIAGGNANKEIAAQLSKRGIIDL
jgi:hypothetical protein